MEKDNLFLKGKLLEVGDLILKVGQGADDPVDVIGMRLEDAVKLIKGKKGTEVRLTVKRMDVLLRTANILMEWLTCLRSISISITLVSATRLPIWPWR